MNTSPYRRSSPTAKRRREEIIKFLYQYQAQNEYLPCIREIAQHPIIDIPSTSVVNYYLDQLQRDNLVERFRKISRGTRLTDEGKTLARSLLGIPAPDKHHCEHCGAPIDRAGKYHKPIRLKVKSKLFKVESSPGTLVHS